MPHEPSGKSPRDASILSGLRDVVDLLYAECRAEQWKLTHKQFEGALERSARKRFSECAVPPREVVEEFLKTLHLEDLALASACMEGGESAWGHFVENYRHYLRAAAGAITKGSHAGTDAQELADSLFAELFGLVDGKRGEASLFRYFHGRSSLKTWLRTVLAQRHIDRIRQSRRFEPLEREDGDGGTVTIGEKVQTPSIDPHREEYARRFVGALAACLELLGPQDRQRLELYYVREKTLAEIGRVIGEHESSVSRNLERIRRELRGNVEQQLRTAQFVDSQGRRKPPLSEAQIALCLQYAGEDALIDFRKLFPEKAAEPGVSRRKESS